MSPLRHVTYLIALALFAVVLVASPLRAHDSWTSGEDVPEWVKRYCCDKTDAHRINPEAVHALQDGFHIDNYPHVIPYHQATPSPDGDYWGFWYVAGEYGREATSTPFCFFAPTMGS